ncbi:MAG: ABC transporter permease [Thermoplasmatales archaeon]|jgi:peptide/nickel transport system permease protein|nr:ABC transporter permease [Candidatus Thermoplasmatota archaeon]MDA8054482.1 ABC transporter permease [Thermoplasmatales archaeon]
MVGANGWYLKSGSPRLNNFKTTFKLLLRNPGSAIGLIVVILYVAVAVIDQVYPRLLGITTDINTMTTNFTHPVPVPPSWLHNFSNWSLPFGTTFPGIDLFQAIIKSIRIDLSFSVAVVAGGCIIGIILGLYSAFFGKWLDQLIMRLTDIFFSIPFLVLAIAAGFFLGRSLEILAIVLILVWWPTYARVVRGQTLSVKEMSYVEAAKSSGVNNFRIMFKHILPNTMAPVIVQVSFDLATMILLLAMLDFIGFTPANAYLPELGYLASVGYGYAAIGDWWTLVFPGLTILLLALSMNLLGDGLRDAFDPRLRR